MSDAANGWTAAVLGWCAEDPGHPGVVTAEETWSRGELSGRAGGAADLLRSLGLPATQPVPGLIDHIGTALALTLGGASTGTTYAPLGTRLTVPELAAVVTRLGSPVLLSNGPHDELAGEVAEAAGVEVVVVPDLPRAEPPTPPGLDGVTVILHTSGTTGLPKQVVVRERTLSARLKTLDGIATIGPGDTYLISAAYFHVGGFGNHALGLGLGTAVAAFPRFTPTAWADLRDQNITAALVVPSMVVDLLDAGALDVHPHLRLLVYGGGPMRPDVLRETMAALPDCQLLNLFGQTEGSPLTALTPADHERARDSRPDLLGSVGKPAPYTSVRVVDPDDDGIGEVLVQGDQLNTVDVDGWLHTGDLGHFDAEGYLFLDGRVGDTINRGGENVRPTEVEDLLRRHPAVREVAVVGVPDRRLGERVAAFVVPTDPDVALDEASLRAFLRAEVAGFKVPEQWVAVDELPRNAGGKVLRRTLVARLTDETPFGG